LIGDGLQEEAKLSREGGERKRREKIKLFILFFLSGPKIYTRKEKRKR
jgi:hypothetical protein